MLSKLAAAIIELKNGHVVRPDSISPELLKCTISQVSGALSTVFDKLWSSGCIPVDWRRSSQPISWLSTEILKQTEQKQTCIHNKKYK